MMSQFYWGVELLRGSDFIFFVEWMQSFYVCSYFLDQEHFLSLLSWESTAFNSLDGEEGTAII